MFARATRKEGKVRIDSPFVSFRFATIGRASQVTVGKLENVPTLPLRCECMSRVRVKFLWEGTGRGGRAREDAEGDG